MKTSKLLHLCLCFAFLLGIVVAAQAETQGVTKDEMLKHKEFAEFIPV